MDWSVISLIVLLAIALVVAVAVAMERQRRLDAARVAIVRSVAGLRSIRPPTHVGEEPLGGWLELDDPADLATLVHRLRARLDASETELNQQVRNASFVADLIGVGILRLADDRTVEIANAAAHVLLGRDPGTLLGRTVIEAFLDAGVEELLATARDRGSSSGEVRPAGPDGPVVIIRVRHSPVTGVWIVLEDVTELRRLQQIRTQFVDNLSHELRTPLSTVSLLAETLAREAAAAGDGVPAKMRDRIAKIEVETGHLVQMVNELLDLARIESGGTLVLRDDVDLGRIATEAAERLRLFAERQGLSLVVDVPERVPAVRGDEARLGQVVVNLVHNALKFGRPEDRDDGASGSPDGSPPGGGEVRVAVRAADGEVILTVEDHGMGIPAADRGRIFERFYKVDRARVRGGGTGLGLAIARHVVQQHGGQIRVDSEEGRGSTFTVSVPVASADPVLLG